MAFITIFVIAYCHIPNLSFISWKASIECCLFVNQSLVSKTDSDSSHKIAALPMSDEEAKGNSGSDWSQSLVLGKVPLGKSLLLLSSTARPGASLYNFVLVADEGNS